MPNKAYQQYKQAQYETASPEKLLLMLYDGAIKFGGQAKDGINNNDYELANEKIKRVQSIINELMVTLDMDKGGEIADNLYKLYEYMNHRLIQANIRKDPEIVEEVLDLLREMKEAWEGAAKKIKTMQSQQTKSGGVNLEG